jgi:hypothetical protein
MCSRGWWEEEEDDEEGEERDCGGGPWGGRRRGCGGGGDGRRSNGCGCLLAGSCESRRRLGQSYRNEVGWCGGEGCCGERQVRWATMGGIVRDRFDIIMRV